VALTNFPFVFLTSSFACEIRSISFPFYFDIVKFDFDHVGYWTIVILFKNCCKRRCFESSSHDLFKVIEDIFETPLPTFVIQQANQCENVDIMFIFFSKTFWLKMGSWTSHCVECFQCRLFELASWHSWHDEIIICWLSFNFLSF
jgi:hypothetical protein